MGSCLQFYRWKKITPNSSILDFIIQLQFLFPNLLSITQANFEHLQIPNFTLYFSFQTHSVQFSTFLNKCLSISIIFSTFRITTTQASWTFLDMFEENSAKIFKMLLSKATYELLLGCRATMILQINFTFCSELSIHKKTPVPDLKCLTVLLSQP